MKHLLLTSAVAVSALLVAGVAGAEEYKDYDYGPGVSQTTLVSVDPNHIDDYLIGLKKTQVPVFLVLKKHGLIDGYGISVKDGGAPHAPNVAIIVHYVSYAAMAPNKERDMMINKEIDAMVPTETDKAEVAKYETYRQFVDIGTWRSVDMSK